MKRLVALLVGVIVATAGLFFVASGGTAYAQSNLNSFRITSYNIDYKLSQDSEKRSTLQTKETIVADFSRPNTNRGIERALPHDYKDHTTSLKIDSIVDEAGNNLEYSTYKNGKLTVLRVGNPDAYVSGVKTYVISYSQRDVTNYFEDTKKSEWYWDTNGTGWRVPIDKLSVSASIDGNLVGSMQGDPFCYQGAFGSTDQCKIESADGIFKTTAYNLRPGENVTIAFGFEKDTFAAYQQSLLDKIFQIWLISLFITTPFAFASIAIMVVFYYRKRNRVKELKIFPAEYIPPKGFSVMTSSQILLGPGSPFGAQLIDFAVRHYIEIIETKEKSFLRLAEYNIKVIRDVGSLLAEEQEILIDMFGRLPVVGDELELKTLRGSYAYSARTMDNDAKLNKLINEDASTGGYGLRSRDSDPSAATYFKRWGAFLLIGGIILVSPLMIFASIFGFAMSATIRPLTDKGLSLRRYLMGLSKYIKAAEKDRIKMLQGPDTAEKVGRAVNTEDKSQMVKLYERTLPYAILYGHEHEWTKRLGDYYQEASQSPDWYNGTSAFNAAVFASAMSNFSYSAASSSGVSSSSGSGGSSGGGSSGGGGGGGGGGGW